MHVCSKQTTYFFGAAAAGSLVAYTSKASWYASALAPTFFANEELDNACGGRWGKTQHTEQEKQEGKNGGELLATELHRGAREASA